MPSPLAPEMEIPLACQLGVISADLSPKCFSSSLDLVRGFGFNHVVLPPIPSDSPGLHELKKILQDKDITPISMFAGQDENSDVRSLNPAARAAGVTLLKRSIDSAHEIGAAQINGVPYGIFGHPTSPCNDEALGFVAEALGATAEYAHSAGITMTFEVLNRYETSVVNTAAQALRLVQLSGSSNLRVHLDTFHMLIEENDMCAAVGEALPKLGYLELGQSSRGLLTHGSADNAKVVRHAASLGYVGPFGIEAFSRPLLPKQVANRLAIWRETYSASDHVLSGAAELIRLAFLQGRRSFLQTTPSTQTAPCTCSDQVPNTHKPQR